MCPECATGKIASKPQICLPCQHFIDIDHLDALYDFDSLYVLKHGIPISGRVSKMPGNTHLACPECHKSFSGVKRYMLVEQLSSLQDNIEGLYAKAGRKINYFQMEIFKVEKILRTSFSNFCKKLTMGLNPMDGKPDMNRVWERTEALMPEQCKITNFRDEVVLPFQISIHKLERFLNNPAILPAQVLPFQLRHDVLYYLCRLTVMEEAIRLYQHFMHADVSSQQVEILKIGLKMKAQDQIKGYLQALDANIDQSKVLHLKRLEVEFRLLQITFWVILYRHFNLQVELDVDGSLEECRLLCGTWPDSAGLLTPILETVQSKYKSNEGSLPVEEWNRSSLRYLWRGWGNYQHAGRLDHCRFHHPYPRISFRDCPECGREIVPKLPVGEATPWAFQEVNEDHNLQNAAFRAMIADLRQASLTGKMRANEEKEEGESSVSDASKRGNALHQNMLQF